jgi:hypothetical protein
MSTAERDRAGITQARAKHLRPQWKESGVFEAVVVHERQGLVANDGSPPCDLRTEPTSTGRPSSDRRDKGRAVSAALLDLWMRIQGVSNRDLGAALNVSESLVRRIRDGSAPLLVGDIELIDPLLPGFFDALRARLRGEK